MKEQLPEKINFDEWASLDCDDTASYLDSVESQLEDELTSELADLAQLEEDRKLIGNPESLGKIVMDTVWEQFLLQIGVTAGEDFIKENRNLTLDLSKSAHIQTAENFAQGDLATHNHYSADQLADNYKRYSETPHKQFRAEYVNKGMDEVLPRAGQLNNNGVETVRDIYTGRQIPTKTKLEDGSNNPMAAQREHVKPSAKVYEDASLQMANDSQQLADIINNPENLQGYTTAKRNNQKSDCTPDEMVDADKTKHWEQADERAEAFMEQKRRQGEERLRAEGIKTRREETLRVTGKSLRAVVIAMMADLVRELMRELIAWFRDKSSKLSDLTSRIWARIKAFFSDIRARLINAADTFATAIATAVFGPVIGLIKKTWMLLKQGFRTIRDAIRFLNNPANKNMPLGVKLLEVSKILIAGITAGGAIVLGEVIEKGLMSVPGFAFPIPMFGSLASITGMLLGGLVSGIIGALALRFIDKLIAKKLLTQNTSNQIDKRGQILVTQQKLIVVADAKFDDTREKVNADIVQRHEVAKSVICDKLQNIKDNEKKMSERSNDKGVVKSDNDDVFDGLLDQLNLI